VHGIISIKEALEIAVNQGLDLVEINPKAEISVCKLLNYSKYRYNSIKKKQSFKKQKVLETKEIKFRYNIQDNDLSNKISRACTFLGNKHNIRVSILFRGREREHTNLGRKVLEKFRDQCLSKFSKLDTDIRSDVNGRQMILSMISRAV
jgi:translation initiation factor IF-3